MQGDLEKMIVRQMWVFSSFALYLTL